MSTKRIKPKVTLTMEPDVHRRIVELQELLPGASFSAIAGELMALSLPVLEGMYEVLKESRDPAGVVDEERARDGLARWAGAQLLGLSDTFDLEVGQEDVKTSA